MPAVIGLSANNGNLQAAPPQQRELASQQYFTTAYKFANPREWMVSCHMLFLEVIIWAVSDWRDAAPDVEEDGHRRSQAVQGEPRQNTQQGRQ